MITSILPNMTPMRDIKQISDGDRLFYEHGQKIDINGGYRDNWIKTGRFEEIEDITTFLEGDKFLEDVEYLEHHNFMIIKKNNSFERNLLIEFSRFIQKHKNLGLDYDCVEREVDDFFKQKN